MAEKMLYDLSTKLREKLGMEFSRMNIMTGHGGLPTLFVGGCTIVMTRTEHDLASSQCYAASFGFDSDLKSHQTVEANFELNRDGIGNLVWFIRTYTRSS